MRRLYLLSCWTFIPTVLGFTDGVMLLLMSEEDFNLKYGAI
jgi:TM2 domain-containing membrane protein YozV